MGYIGDQFCLHPFGFQLLLGSHHRHIRQSIQFPGKILEAADQHPVIHLGIQITLAHPLRIFQQNRKGAGRI